MDVHDEWTTDEEVELRCDEWDICDACMGKHEAIDALVIESEKEQEMGTNIAIAACLAAASALDFDRSGRDS